MINPTPAPPGSNLGWWIGWLAILSLEEQKKKKNFLKIGNTEFNFQEKTLGSWFSGQQKYFGEKCENIVASEKKFGHIGDPSGRNIEL